MVEQRSSKPSFGHVRACFHGRDPITDRNRQQEKTFGECADLYIASMEGNWRNEKHRYQWRQTLTNYCRAIRQKPVATISTDDVLQVLKPIWTTKSETASRLRGRIELTLDFARARGWREGENPARWRGHLRNVLPPRKRLSRGHLAAMDYRDVPAFMGRLRQVVAVSARALEFAILTAGRTSEVLNATWSEIDVERAVWTVPKHRMKGAEEHAVPLSDPALMILRPLHEIPQSNYIFPGLRQGKPLSGMAMEMLLRRMNVKKATVHGFRSSFRDWCGDETHFSREIAEAALAHKVGNLVEQDYRRSKALEKRRELMEAWAAYCEPRQSGKVVQMKRKP
jgi:integrase